MRKQLFETKIKDGLWLLGVVAVVMVASLTVDDVTGSFRRGKIKAVLYVPSYEVPADGPALKVGDGVRLYKQVIGRVLDVKFFVASVQKPLDSDATPPPEPPPSAPKNPLTGDTASGTETAAATPTPAPSPAAAAAAPGSAIPPSRPELVSGLKIEVELYKGDFPQVLALVTPESGVKVESQTLGESSVLIMTSTAGRPLAQGDRVNFPRNHVSLVKLEDESTRWGKELSTEAEVTAIREQIKLLAPKSIPVEPKKDPRDEF